MLLLLCRGERRRPIHRSVCTGGGKQKQKQQAALFPPSFDDTEEKPNRLNTERMVIVLEISAARRTLGPIESQLARTGRVRRSSFAPPLGGVRGRKKGGKQEERGAEEAKEGRGEAEETAEGGECVGRPRVLRGWSEKDEGRTKGSVRVSFAEKATMSSEKCEDGWRRSGMRCREDMRGTYCTERAVHSWLLDPFSYFVAFSVQRKTGSFDL